MKTGMGLMRRMGLMGLMGLVATVVVLAGCARKPGGMIEGQGLYAIDPSNAKSQVIVGYDASSILSGVGVVETSMLNDDGLNETGAGGAAKHRKLIRVPMNVKLPDGSLESRWLTVAESTAANEQTDEWTVKGNADGTFAEFTIRGASQDNAVVHAQVVKGLELLAPVMITGTEQEVMQAIKQLEVQGVIGKAAIEQIVPLVNAIRLAMGGV